MRKVITSIIGVCIMTLVFSCKNDKLIPATQEVKVGTQSLSKSEGTDCDQPDSLRARCANLNLNWPQIEQGSDALKNTVNAWAKAYITGILSPHSDENPNPEASIDEKAEAFIQLQRDFVKEAPESPMGYYTAESDFDVLLNDGKYLTLEITGYIYAGGNHGNPTAAVATFDVVTGKQLTWADLVSDTSALKTLAEKTFREERSDLFNPSDGSEPYAFNEIFAFALPQNYGLTEDGIYCHYLAYEVGPYAIGSTQMIIPYSELGQMLKVQPPVPSGSTSDVPEMYEVKGGSVILPPFEIEVKSSQKATQTLTRDKETIIVAAFFSGIPSDPKNENEIGTLDFLQPSIELTGNEKVARFENLKIPKSEFNKLKDKDIDLLINVYSGRKSSQDNLLDCGLLEMKASKFGNKRFVIGCKLIEESPGGGVSQASPIATYTLPAAGTEPALLITCDENGTIEWAGQPVKDYAALKAALRTYLLDLKQSGTKQLPNLETEGCMMGNSGEIRTMYDELKSEL